MFASIRHGDECNNDKQPMLCGGHNGHDDDGKYAWAGIKDFMSKNKILNVIKINIWLQNGRARIYGCTTKN